MNPSMDKTLQLKELIQVLKSNLNEVYINNTNIWSNTGWSLNKETTSSDRFSFDMYNVIEGSVNLTIGKQAITFHASDVFFIDNTIDHSCKNWHFTIFGFNFYISEYNTINIHLYNQLYRKMK